jgi:hypothetical protein
MGLKSYGVIPIHTGIPMVKTPKYLRMKSEGGAGAVTRRSGFGDTQALLSCRASTTVETGWISW